LLAGKLHAILQRAYTKGRDIYDLLWYLRVRLKTSQNSHSRASLWNDEIPTSLPDRPQ